MRKIRLIVLNPYDSLQFYEHRPMQEAKYFQKQGHEVEVFILQRKVIGKGTIENSIDGIPVKHFLCKSANMEQLLNTNVFIKKIRSIIYALWFLKFIIWLKNQLKTDERTYLIAHNLEMAFAACVVNRKKKFSVVFVMREWYEGQTLSRLKRGVIKRISQWVQNESDTLVHVGQVQFDTTQKRNRKKILYIPNYPEAKNYSDIEHVKSDKIRINYIGSVRDVKSLKMLMDAADGLERISIGIHGMGEAYGKLKEIESCYRNVCVTGYYDYQTMTKKLFSNTDILYCAYDISVPNWRVAYPIKLYEAIEVGVPVLLCRGMAPEKFVCENDCGYLFDYNVESLREVLLNIQENGKDFMKKCENMRKLKGKYTWDSVVKEYDKAILK